VNFAQAIDVLNVMNLHRAKMGRCAKGENVNAHLQSLIKIKKENA
jgi:hypothetical protein